MEVISLMRDPTTLLHVTVYFFFLLKTFLFYDFADTCSSWIESGVNDSGFLKHFHLIL